MRTTLIGLAVLGVSWGSYAHAFDNLTDATPGKYFDPAASTVDDGVLSIGLHTGINPTTWQSREFTARNGVASDVLTFTLDGCPTSLTYTVRGTYQIQRNGTVVALATLSVDGAPSVDSRRVVASGVGKTGTFEMQLSAAAPCIYSATVAASLVAVDGAAGSASVKITSAEVEAQ